MVGEARQFLQAEGLRPAPGIEIPASSTTVWGDGTTLLSAFARVFPALTEDPFDHLFEQDRVRDTDIRGAEEDPHDRRTDPGRRPERARRQIEDARDRRVQPKARIVSTP